MTLAGGTLGHTALARAWQQPAAAPPAVTPVFTAIRRNVGFFTGRGGTIGYLLAPGGAQLPAEQWSAIGKTIAAFHREGVHHADLNAHNIMVEHAIAPRVYLLDFDRGRIEPRGGWEQDVLARLRRSLDKIKAQRPNAAFGEAEWQSLLSASVEN
jgi:hypothetical protein